MEDSEVERIYQEMVEMFGETLPNPVHYPKCFGHYVMMYKRRKNSEKQVEVKENA